MLSNKRHRLLLGLFLLGIASGVGYSMYSRVGQGELWSHLPLFLYLTLYGSALSFLSLRWEETITSWKQYPLALSSLSGVLLGLGFPGFLPFPFLLLVAWVPLLLAHREISDKENSYRRVWWTGFNAFLLYNILASFWVTNTAFAAGVFAIVVNSFLMGLPWLAFHWTSRRSPKVAYLALPAFWLAFEYFHYNWSLNWPWLTLGNGFAQFPSLIQWYEITGVLGGSAWIFLVNFLVLRVYQGFTAVIPNDSAPAVTPKTTSLRRPMLLLILALVIPMGASLLRYFTYETPAGDTIRVATIQPNFEPHFEKFSSDPVSQVDTFLRLSRQALEGAGPVDYLVYPETSFSYVNEDEPLQARSLNELYRSLREEDLRYLVTGFDGYHFFAPGEPLTPAVRYVTGRNGEEVALEALNALVQIDLQSGEVQTYRKGVFVPGAESFPFRETLFFLEPLVNSLGGTVAGRGTQDVREALVGERAKIAPVICYESVFGEYFTEYIREGAEAIFVVTNDGWWDNTAGHRQHNWFSSLRAIETRRAVVRSANMGNCSFIDQRGKVLRKTPYGQEGFLVDDMPLNQHLTPYVRFGDLTARIALLLSAMLLLGNLARTIRLEAFAQK
ncbi:apolipoprotein N-acyltransferase [Lewinella sp. W8]|uniref:apolipoprotein N-acyltransferase n=1 Tax=Lewinella sp. W8 TaxID=2528208 RepID=UPI0010673E9E|nr:apolipoprotein N-acyltransferase [Lewinella sp. W8]MTB52327.1 apolipoprotein N-acyltransferase [Lewinella sp. W8]